MRVVRRAQDLGALLALGGTVPVVDVGGRHQPKGDVTIFGVVHMWVIRASGQRVRVRH